MLLFILKDVAAGPDAMANAYSGRTVPPVLEPGQAVALGRYRPHYPLSLGLTGDRWVIVMQRLLIGLFELNFDHLNTNSTV
jgi:hypothetical protein